MLWQLYCQIMHDLNALLIIVCFAWKFWCLPHILIVFFRFFGSTGAFNMSFEENCLIQIEAPSEESRLFFTCTPVPLGDCSMYMDTLAINLLGDSEFRQNSFLYCGRNARIQAISLRHKLAIRVKRMKENPVSTFCTFHARQQRQYGATQYITSCGKLGRGAKVTHGKKIDQMRVMSVKFIFWKFDDWPFKYLDNRRSPSSSRIVSVGCTTGHYEDWRKPNRMHRINRIATLYSDSGALHEASRVGECLHGWHW